MEDLRFKITITLQSVENKELINDKEKRLDLKEEEVEGET